MSDYNETHAEAVAALRKWGTRHFARSAKVRHFCDRIEEAYKREMSKIVSKNGADFGQLCDAARLREALEQLSDKVCDYLQKGLIQLPLPIEGLLKQARDALSAPPRACDIMPEENLVKVVSSGIMQSITSRPEFNFDGLKTLVEVVAASAIKCAYDTQLISKGATDGSK